MKKIIFTLFLYFVFFSLSARSNVYTGKASYYADKFHGRKTTSGEPYDKRKFTAAHKTLPFNTLVKVTLKKNAKSVIVRINDRGPHVKGRIIDLSRIAADKIGLVNYGVAPVSMIVIGKGKNNENPTQE